MVDHSGSDMLSQSVSISAGAQCRLTVDAQINGGSITPYVGNTAGSALSTGNGQQRVITPSGGSTISFSAGSATGGVANVSLEVWTDHVTYEDQPIDATMTHAYEYDLAGNKTKITVDDSRDTCDSAQYYGYDALNRLTKEERTGYSPYTISYGFDAAGNRTAMTKVSGGVTKATAYEHNAGNELTKFTCGADNTTYYYDGAGQLTKRTAVAGGSPTDTTFQWDQLGRMTLAVAGGAAVDYAYDAGGKRVFRAASGLTKMYSYQGENLLSYEDNTGPSLPPTWQDHVFTVGPGAVGNALERHDPSGGSTTSCYYQYDERGNVRFITDSAGQIQGVYDTDSYGNLLCAKNGSGSDISRPDILQTGKDFDPATGLYYFNARWYDPETGRFVSRAPMRPNCEEPYIFAADNPLSRVDPLGLKSCFGEAAAKLGQCLLIDGLLWAPVIDLQLLGCLAAAAASTAAGPATFSGCVALLGLIDAGLEMPLVTLCAKKAYDAYKECKCKEGQQQEEARQRNTWMLY